MDPMRRRSVLTGLAAAPALLTFRTTGAAALTPAPDAGGSTAGGGTRYFPWPRVAPGTRITWPAGAVALSADGRSRRSLAGLAAVPARGAPGWEVYLTGFTDGAYTLATHGRRTERVAWDADRFGYLRVWGEFGQRTCAPCWGQYFGLIITPVTRPAQTKATRS